ncbi:hypothetical protein RIF29_38115 [Crotalaria pallida]|uniref:Helitron helicase-like domain-containing protein n=1 Tax=Crotalaria pallida TaxID=3830 RepID=A0AAN9E500_CROPI
MRQSCKRNCGSCIELDAVTITDYAYSDTSYDEEYFQDYLATGTMHSSILHSIQMSNNQLFEIAESLDASLVSDLMHMFDEFSVLAQSFRQLDAMMDDFKKGYVFGTVIAGMYTIEFQKRGLPHAHILLWLHPDGKLNQGHDSHTLLPDC